MAHEIFRKLHDNGFLEERKTAQLYCEAHKSIVADRLVEGECLFCGYSDARGDQCDSCGRVLGPLQLVRPRCKVHGSAPATRDSNHIYLGLDKLQPDVESLFGEVATNGGWPSNARSITSAWLGQGLNPFSITRDFQWGTPVPLPGYEHKVMYPWFDACIGYVSITACYTDQWEAWWRSPDDVQLYQFVGKDNVPFHSVVFPATQIGTGDTWTMVHHLSATEYLTYEGGKFSKSRGIGVFGDSAQRTGVPSDVWRFYLLSCRPETQDSAFSWNSFIVANNSLLVEGLGGFVAHVLTFINMRYDGVVPSWDASTDPSFDGRRQQVDGLLSQYIRDLDAVKLRAGLSIVLQIAKLGSDLLQPNELHSNLHVVGPPECAAVVGFAVNLVHLLASLVAPFMPDTAEAINAQLCAAPLPIPDRWHANTIMAGHNIGQAGHLFSHIDPGKAQEWRGMFGSNGADKASENEVLDVVVGEAEAGRGAGLDEHVHVETGHE